MGGVEKCGGSKRRCGKCRGGMGNPNTLFPTLPFTSPASDTLRHFPTPYTLTPYFSTLLHTSSHSFSSSLLTYPNTSTHFPTPFPTSPPSLTHQHTFPQFSKHFSAPLPTFPLTSPHTPTHFPLHSGPLLPPHLSTHLPLPLHTQFPHFPTP